MYGLGNGLLLLDVWNLGTLGDADACSGGVLMLGIEGGFGLNVYYLGASAVK